MLTSDAPLPPTVCEPQVDEIILDGHSILNNDSVAEAKTVKAPNPHKLATVPHKSTAQKVPQILYALLGRKSHHMRAMSRAQMATQTVVTTSDATKIMNCAINAITLPLP